MENKRFDLFYEETNYPWHYDRAGYRHTTPIGSHWNLIAEDQDERKLKFFTNYYFRMRLNYSGGLFPETNNPPLKVVKTLWNEFEVFITCVFEQVANNNSFLELFKDYETPNIDRDIRPRLNNFGYKEIFKKGVDYYSLP
jgi:transcription initiation factor IIF auxiliary subunit